MVPDGELPERLRIFRIHRRESQKHAGRITVFPPPMKAQKNGISATVSKMRNSAVPGMESTTATACAFEFPFSEDHVLRSKQDRSTVSIKGRGKHGRYFRRFSRDTVKIGGAS